MQAGEATDGAAAARKVRDGHRSDRNDLRRERVIRNGSPVRRVALRGDAQDGARSARGPKFEAPVQDAAQLLGRVPLFEERLHDTPRTAQNLAEIRAQGVASFRI